MRRQSLKMGTTDDSSIHQEEDISTAGVSSGHTASAVKHGDRAAELIGDERVVLTEEDVSFDLNPNLR
jgi:hypothetical protein